MVDKQQRAMLVVPYNPGPPPRMQLAFALLCGLGAAVSAVLLFVADYSTTVAAGIAAATVVLALGALASAIAGMRARRRFRVEMERAVDVSPAPEAQAPSRSERVI